MNHLIKKEGVKILHNRTHRSQVFSYQTNYGMIIDTWCILTIKQHLLLFYNQNSNIYLENYIFILQFKLNLISLLHWWWSNIMSMQDLSKHYLSELSETKKVFSSSEVYYKPICIMQIFWLVSSQEIAHWTTNFSYKNF